MAGCVSMQQQAVSPPASSASPPQLGAAAMPPSVPIFHKTTAAGTAMLLNNATSITPDCALLALPVARIVQEPAHGTVRFLRQNIFPSYRPNDPHAGCNKVKVPGIVAEYTPAAGFVGADFVILEYIFKDGRDDELKFSITVK
jgi:hypothetical protein